MPGINSKYFSVFSIVKILSIAVATVQILNEEKLEKMN
jgi:hypothetical protein